VKKQLAVSALVVDFNLYPRNTVQEVHVSDLVRALESGAMLPPIVIEKSTGRIVDGVHRRLAVLKHSGPDTVIDVDARDFKSDAELFLEAVRLNSMHGRKLDRADQTRIVLKLQEFQVPPQSISMALHVPEATVQMLALRFVTDSSGEQHPQKRGIEHLRGQQLSDAQLSALKTVRSAEAGRLALELTRLIDNDLVDLEDRDVLVRFQSLAKSLAGCIKQIKKAS
jgi:hypothetical protein